MLKIIEGDLLEIKSGIIMHQVNCRGATGGLAGALRRKWPECFRIYAGICDENDPNELLGGALDERSSDGKLLIYHIFGQFDPGPNTDMEAVENAMSGLGKSFRLPNAPTGQLYAPFKIGCGLGGGDWVQYSAIIEKHLPQTIIVRKYK